MAGTGGDGPGEKTMKDEGLELVMLVDALGQLASAPPADSLSQRQDDFVLLYTKLTELRSAQSGTPHRHAAVGSTDFDPFMDYLKAGGVDTSKVEIAKFGDAGNGLRATTALAKGDNFLQIPVELMMSTETAKTSSVAKFIAEDPLVCQMPNVTLALHVLAELGRGAASQWAPYIATLPATYTTPLYYTLEEFGLLRGSTAWDPAVGLFRSIVRQFAYIYKQLHKSVDVRKQMGYAKPSLFTFEDYRWAVSAVMTRQNKVPLGGTAFEPEFGLALIPLWDMINHANGELTSAHDIAKQVTECAAMQPFAQGEQIVMFYGPRPNAELLLHSGFVMEGNPHDFVTVKLGVGKSDPLGALKAQLLEALTIPRAGDFVIDHDGELDPQLNAFIRINAMTAEELRGFLGNPASCATLGDPAVPASEENEEKACSFIETRCKLLLRAYRSSIDDDDALLRKPDIPYTTRSIVLLRRGEKRVLMAAAAKAAERALEEDL
eukprot:m.50743 g.50743  ORF g.50743 m.50743 type:complete len:492 (+) comp9025_c0_seq2:224-1699(+)